MAHLQCYLTVANDLCRLSDGTYFRPCGFLVVKYLDFLLIHVDGTNGDKVMLVVHRNQISHIIRVLRCIELLQSEGIR